MPSVTLRIRRQDPRSKTDPRAHWEEFVVPYDVNLTVLEGLFYVQERLDAGLAFRYCCRASICGSCAMYIDGAYRLACQTNVKHLNTSVVTVEPMPHLVVIKDLVCAMDDFFAKYERVLPWLIRDVPDAGEELRQTPEERKKLDMPVDCILCGSCYSSCPSVWGEDDYLGPAALLKAYRFELDSRDEAGRARLPRFDNERGVYRCHTIMNCVEACPKGLSPTEGIQWLKRAAVRRRLLRRSK
ncbi:MAG: succinate dehydrogenase/fumarate reductase iron-sulfur subunit [Thermoleophilia bacterium]|jgi:succinate dehydrogenase / fumarate reductase iron-sulfur subunit